MQHIPDQYLCFLVTSQVQVKRVLDWFLRLLFPLSVCLFVCRHLSHAQKYIDHYAGS